MYKVYILTFCFTVILSDKYKKDKNRDILVLLSRIFYHYEYVNVRNLNRALLMKFLHLFNCCSLETPQNHDAKKANKSQF